MGGLESFQSIQRNAVELDVVRRQTVVGREGPVFAGLEFGGFLDVPHRVSIKIRKLWFSLESNREFLASMCATPPLFR